MARSKSSGQWLQQHHRDPYVQKARQSGYRSRASYKLIEIQEKDRLVKPGMCVVDLGAAPGGWSQLLATWVGSSGTVVAMDLLEMAPLDGVTFLQGDFTEKETYDVLCQQLQGQGVDVIVSDMAPNMSGIQTADQARVMGLAEAVLAFVEQSLKPGGALLVKVFQGVGFETYLRDLRHAFTEVKTRKPDASRSKSRELYLLAKGYRGNVPMAGDN